MRHADQTTDPHTALLTLCAALQDAGIWLYLKADTGGLIAGPTALVQQHPQLLKDLRTQKDAITRLLEDSLAHALFGEKADDPRFERQVCPDCGRECYVLTAPRRLEVHRLPDNQAVCPGSARAQEALARTLMEPFIADRCVQRPGATLSWYSLRGALATWCVQRGFFQPPRPYLIAWMDAHYTRVHASEELPMWRGLTLTIEEWFGDDETPQETPQTPPKKKTVLTA